MTQLTKMMLEELQRRNYSQTTVNGYLKIVEDFARHFGRSPDQLGPDQIRAYQVHLFNERSSGARHRRAAHCGAAVLLLQDAEAALPASKKCRIRSGHGPCRSPDPGRSAATDRLSQQSVHRAMLMTLYSTGMRRAEMCQLKVTDIDSERMLIHIRHGKGGRDRDVPLSPKLLETLREYWRWMKPKTYLFPGTVNGWRADKPITPKMLVGSLPGSSATSGHHKARYAAHSSPLVSRRTCWKEEPTCPPCRCCSDTPTSSTPHLPASFRTPSARRWPTRSTATNSPARTR